MISLNHFNKIYWNCKHLRIKWNLIQNKIYLILYTFVLYTCLWTDSLNYKVQTRLTRNYRCFFLRNHKAVTLLAKLIHVVAKRNVWCYFSFLSIYNNTNLKINNSLLYNLHYPEKILQRKISYFLSRALQCKSSRMWQYPNILLFITC